MLPFAHYAVLEQCKNVRYFFVLSGLIIMNESRPNSGSLGTKSLSFTGLLLAICCIRKHF